MKIIRLKSAAAAAMACALVATAADAEPVNAELLAAVKALTSQLADLKEEVRLTRQEAAKARAEARGLRAPAGVPRPAAYAGSGSAAPVPSAGRGDNLKAEPDWSGPYAGLAIGGVAPQISSRGSFGNTSRSGAFPPPPFNSFLEFHHRRRDRRASARRRGRRPDSIGGLQLRGRILGGCRAAGRGIMARRSRGPEHPHGPDGAQRHTCCRVPRLNLLLSDAAFGLRFSVHVKQHVPHAGGADMADVRPAPRRRADHAEHAVLCRRRPELHQVRHRLFRQRRQYRLAGRDLGHRN